MIFLPVNYVILFVFSWVLFFSALAQENTSSDSLITLQDALAIAEKNYPLIKAKNINISKSESEVKLNKLAYLPQLDASLQGNYSTVNNIYGLFYPQPGILPISGPVSSKNNYNPVLGSAGGLQLSWEATTFGKRSSDISHSYAGLEEAKSELNFQVFILKFNIINTYVDWLASLNQIKIQESNFQRSKVFYQTAQVLTSNGLKPGIDTSLAKADIAQDYASLIKAQEASVIYQIKINELLGNTTEKIKIKEITLIENEVTEPNNHENKIQHPILGLYQSRIETINARSISIKRSYHPKVMIYSSFFARGSGATNSGNFDHSLSGLSFSRYNYVIGATLGLPILQYPLTHTQYIIESKKANAEKELFNEQKLKLSAENEVADLKIKYAIETARQYKTQVDAAKDAYSKIISMYSSGLSTQREVAQTQYLLNKAELEYLIANITIWKAYLYKAEMIGDLNYFLNRLTR
jgi:outer membrane protein TolC